MKTGDTIEIEGRFGFLMNPKLKILETKGSLAKVISVDRIGDNKGLLSHMNESWHGIELLKEKVKK